VSAAVEVLPPLSRASCPSCRLIEAENQRLLAALKMAVATAAGLAAEVEATKAENTKLKALLEEVRRKGKRQSRPFSKGNPKPDPKKPGRKSGDKHGKHGHRQRPDHVDETVDVPPPEFCPDCGGEVEPEDVFSDDFQADIPPIRPHVTCFHSRRGRCKKCRRRSWGRDPRQNSTARGAAAPHVGPRAMALASQLHTGLGLSFGKLSYLFQMVFGLSITRGGLVQILHRVARKAAPTYQALVRTVANASLVVPDETGWHVGGVSAWLWVFVVPGTDGVTVYLVARGRGFEDACLVLPADFDGRLARDGWSVYRRYEDAIHQTCLAHILRRCHELLETAQRGAARVPHAVQDLIQDAFALRRRREEETISARGMRIAIGKLEARADRLFAWEPTDDENRKLLKHLRQEHERGAVFAFLHDLEIPATNFWAEQEVRPIVVTRKVWGGNRTWDGAWTQQVLGSVLRTGQRQGQDPITLLVPVLCSPHPVVADLRGLWSGPDPPPPGPDPPSAP